MTTLLGKRFLAFVVDYFVIALYATVLLIITLLIYKLFDLEPAFPNPITGQVIGFLTLTLPAFSYFYLSEKSKRKGTIGKKKLGIHVEAEGENSDRKILLRNILKLLPWEIAHTGVHWVVYISRNTNDTPYWVWILLMVPQLLVACYVFSIILYKGESSFYDKISKTKIVLTT